MRLRGARPEVGGGNVFTNVDGRSVYRPTPTGQNLEAGLRGPTDIAAGAGGAVIVKG
jgi:hypothetical protein